jgi:Flp pilus assembly protein TadG
VSTGARGRQARRRNAGQALVEFSLVLPVLALIFMGVLDLGRAYHTQVALANAARVGIIYAQQGIDPTKVPQGCTLADSCAPLITVGDITTKTVAEAQGSVAITPSNVKVCLGSTCPVTNMATAVSNDEPITISITIPFAPITPFVHLTRISGSVSGRTFSF